LDTSKIILSYSLAAIFLCLSIWTSEQTFAQVSNDNLQSGSQNTKVDTFTVNEQTRITLSGLGLNDTGLGQNISYKWKQIAGDRVTISNDAAATISFVTPAVMPGQIKNLAIILTITGDTHLTKEHAFSLIVLHVNHPPVTFQSLLSMNGEGNGTVVYPGRSINARLDYKLWAGENL